jgi:uncharacterized protein YaaN involved in tellurite resistance
MTNSPLSPQLAPKLAESTQPTQRKPFAVAERPLPNHLGLLDLKPAPETRIVPRLSDSEKQQAEQLAGQLNVNSPHLVLTFGEKAQTAVASVSSTLLSSTSMADSGKAGQLLGQLQETVGAVDTSTLRGASHWFGKLVQSLPFFGSTAKDRIDTFVARHEKVQPVLQKMESLLHLEQGKATVSSEQIDTMVAENRLFLKAVSVAQAAMIIAENRLAESYEAKRQELVASGSQDLSEITELKGMWENLQRLDRRVYALEASTALAATNEVQMRRVQEMLNFNAEALQEARVVALPNWRANMALAVTALQANDQAEMINAFRQMSDQLVQGTSNLLAELEGTQANMQRRTFIAAEIIAQVNHQLATGISSSIKKQIEAKQARDEGLKLIQESQRVLADAMRGSGTELVQTSALDISSKPGEMDLAASLLEMPVDLKKAA